MASTLTGLKQVDTKFVIKVRGDEAYEDLSKFLEYFHEDNNCFVTNNVWFRPDWFAKFHPSDHVIGGCTNLMTTAFEYLNEKLRTPPFFAPGVSEMIIARALLKAKNIEPDETKSKEIMKANFHLVRVSEMGKCIIAYNSAGVKFYAEDHMIHSSNMPTITSMDDL